jgi:hypothetical protein
MARAKTAEHEEQHAELETPQVETPPVEEGAKEEKPKPEKRKFPLPEGYVTPVAFRHELVKQGLADEKLSSAQIYILSRKAANNGMPIKHFNRAGESFDTLQTHPESGETLTRPGLKMDEGLDWWRNRPKRQPGQKKEKEEAKGEAAEASTADETAAAEAEVLEDLEAAGDFNEAE